MGKWAFNFYLGPWCPLGAVRGVYPAATGSFRTLGNDSSLDSGRGDAKSRVLLQTDAACRARWLF